MMDEATKRQIAEQLTGLTGGKIRVAYEPDAYYQTDDETARLASVGHQYVATLDESMREFWLDDRQPLHAQMAKELRRIALQLVMMATTVEAEAGKDG